MLSKALPFAQSDNAILLNCSWRDRTFWVMLLSCSKVACVRGTAGINVRTTTFSVP